MHLHSSPSSCEFCTFWELNNHRRRVRWVSDFPGSSWDAVPSASPGLASLLPLLEHSASPFPHLPAPRQALVLPPSSNQMSAALGRASHPSLLQTQVIPHSVLFECSAHLLFYIDLSSGFFPLSAYLEGWTVYSVSSNTDIAQVLSQWLQTRF